MTQSMTLTNDTLSEQRAWLAEEADKAIAASGVPDGWHERLYERPSYPWTGPSEERDREDGAILGFTASEKGLLIQVMTSCSVNESVGNWMAHLGEKNDSMEEQPTREQVQIKRPRELKTKIDTAEVSIA